MQHQSFAAKQWFGESLPNLGVFRGSDVSSHHAVWFVFGCGPGQLSEAFASSGFVVHAALWILSFGDPSYDAKTRLRLSTRNVLVESLPLREESGFCLYRLFDEKGRSFELETAWTPCFSIDTLFERS